MTIKNSRADDIRQFKLSPVEQTISRSSRVDSADAYRDSRRDESSSRSVTSETGRDPGERAVSLRDSEKSEEEVVVRRRESHKRATGNIFRSIDEMLKPIEPSLRARVSEAEKTLAPDSSRSSVSCRINETLPDEYAAHCIIVSSSEETDSSYAVGSKGLKTANSEAETSTKIALVCETCSKTFSFKRSLTRHRALHRRVKKHACPHCGKTFRDSHDLKRHVRTHTGIKPFKCRACDMTFGQRCTLESHESNIHGVVHPYAYKERREKVYVCEDCGHLAESSEDYYNHLAGRHPDSPALLRSGDRRSFQFQSGLPPPSMEGF